jgi:hypothetical protein
MQVRWTELGGVELFLPLQNRVMLRLLRVVLN